MVAATAFQQDLVLAEMIAEFADEQRFHAILYIITGIG